MQLALAASVQAEPQQRNYIYFFPCSWNQPEGDWGQPAVMAKARALSEGRAQSTHVPGAAASRWPRHWASLSLSPQCEENFQATSVGVLAG